MAAAWLQHASCMNIQASRRYVTAGSSLVNRLWLHGRHCITAESGHEALRTLYNLSVIL